MKEFTKILIIGISMSVASLLFSQQDAMFTQYMFNEVTINPAYAGSHEVMSMTGLVRRQWVGIDGAPSTQSFNIHTPLRNNKIGVGLSIVNDKVAVTNNLNIHAAGSYRLDLSETTHLQLGLQLGITNHQTDLGNLNVEDETEQVFSEGSVSEVLPNFGGGLYLFSDKFYVGLSIPQLMNNVVSKGGVNLVKQRRHIFLTTGYVFTLNQNLKLKPTLFYKYVQGSPMQLDVTGSLIIKDKFWVGLAWRTFDSADLLLGFQATEQLFAGYAFDYSLTNLSDHNTGSHELVVNYRFSFSKNKILTPRYF
jgi:type IX secretion system PorP/SprF family membrane protein